MGGVLTSGVRDERMPAAPLATSAPLAEKAASSPQSFGRLRHNFSNGVRSKVVGRIVDGAGYNTERVYAIGGIIEVLTKK